MGIETVLVGIAALPVGQLRDGWGPAFADNVEVRVFVHDGLAPVSSRLLLIIRVCIDTESVKTGILDPPYRPLYEILEHIWIIEVHIHHRRHEPAAFLNIKILPGCVRVHIRREGYVGTCICIELMDPVLERKVIHPPMLGAAMIRHHVHDYAQSLFVGLGNERTVEFVASEARVDMVIIRCGIAVV